MRRVSLINGRAHAFTYRRQSDNSPPKIFPLPTKSLFLQNHTFLSAPCRSDCRNAHIYTLHPSIPRFPALSIASTNSKLPKGSLRTANNTQAPHACPKTRGCYRAENIRTRCSYQISIDAEGLGYWWQVIEERASDHHVQIQTRRESPEKTLAEGQPNQGKTVEEW